MHSLEPVHLAADAGEDRAALSGHPRKANAGQYDIVLQQRKPARNRDTSTRSLAAGAGEDRAALSGHPRKANAGQYESVLHQGQHKGVMQQRRSARKRDATKRPSTNASHLIKPALRARSACGDFTSGLGALLFYLVVRNSKVLKRLRDNIAHHRGCDRSTEVPLLLVRIVNDTQHH